MTAAKKPAAKKAPTPRVVPRRTWGASAPLGPPMPMPARDVYVHHSVTVATANPHADMRAIERVGVARFGQMSYSYAIHPDGTIMEGAGLTVGAHTLHHNWHGFGIVLIGNYDRQTPTGAQGVALVSLVAHLNRAGALADGYTMAGHRKVKATACPGANVPDRLVADWHKVAVVGK